MITNYKGFTDELLEGHLNLGFGSMGKKDIDLLILKYIINTHTAKNNGELDYFELSKELRITEASLKRKVKEVQARYFYDTYDNGEFENRLVQIIENNRFHIEGDKIKMLPNDPMFTQYMHKYAYELNTFLDGSFNSEIIVIRMTDFLKIISLIIKNDTKYIELFNNKEILKEIENLDIEHDKKNVVINNIIDNSNNSGTIIIGNDNKGSNDKKKNTDWVRKILKILLPSIIDVIWEYM